MALANSIRAHASRRFIPVLVVAVVLAALPGFSQDPKFDWSWKEGGDKTKPEAAVNPPATKPMKTANSGDNFDWSWDGKTTNAVVGVIRAPAAGTPGQPVRIRDDEAYQKLLKENLTLRREIAEATKGEALSRKENQRLATEITDMERNLGQSVQIIKTLKLAHDGAISPDQVNELEVRLAQAEKAKQTLAVELERLKRLKEKEPAGSKSATAGISEDSDLFQARERENVLLKKRLGEIESERRRLETEAAASKTESAKSKKDAEKAKAALVQLNEKAKAAARQGAQYKKIVAKLPEIEEQVSSLRTDVAMKNEKLSLREQQLSALQVELDRREYRLAKAQKMADLLAKTRAEVLQSNNREKLDMHYNMAVIYAKEGRSRDAEAEYLRALRIDPSDAEIHYNLGILYDQDLNNAKRAIMHYRRYLTIRPTAADVDQVKSWIMELQM